jgi:hypothetical protein
LIDDHRSTGILHPPSVVFVPEIALCIRGAHNHIHFRNHIHVRIRIHRICIHPIRISCPPTRDSTRRASRPIRSLDPLAPCTDRFRVEARSRSRRHQLDARSPSPLSRCPSSPPTWGSHRPCPARPSFRLPPVPDRRDGQRDDCRTSSKPELSDTSSPSCW